MTAPPTHPPGVDVGRARSWFWLLTTVAVLAMGAIYRALQSPPGAATGLAVLLSGLVLAAASTQAARTLLALNGPAHLPVRLRRPTRRGSGGPRSPQV
jgi:hypothetical protein